MGKKRKNYRPTLTDSVALGIGAITILCSFFLLIPVIAALTAGLAGLSIVVFVPVLIALGVLLFHTSHIIRLFLIAALCFGVLGLVIPQVAYVRTAQQAGVTLSFNLADYLEFSGATDLPPTQEYVYKELPKQSLKVAYYKSPREGKRPLVVIFHGGAWRYGDHLETGQWPAVLTSAGYHVASVEYRLSNDTYHTWQDSPADVHDAVSYLKAHADELSIDQSKIHLLGQSAGGHLALLEAYRFPEVSSVTALYAPIDLTLDYETSRDKSAELDFIGGSPDKFAQRYRAVSPIAYTSKQSPRTLLIQGKNDDLVHHENTRRLSRTLEGFGVYHESILLPLTGHSFENQRGSFATQIATERVVKFLNQ